MARTSGDNALDLGHRLKPSYFTKMRSPAEFPLVEAALADKLKLALRSNLRRRPPHFRSEPRRAKPSQVHLQRAVGLPQLFLIRCSLRWSVQSSRQAGAVLRRQAVRLRRPPPLAFADLREQHRQYAKRKGGPRAA